MDGRQAVAGVVCQGPHSRRGCVSVRVMLLHSPRLLKPRLTLLLVPPPASSGFCTRFHFHHVVHLLVPPRNHKADAHVRTRQVPGLES
jgi:hypothetical protein